jgi:N-acylneuraminate cytidylyltransferase
VLIEVVECYRQTGIYSENICCILPTAPLITSQNIVKAYNLITESDKYFSIYPVVAFSYPVLRSLKMDEQYISMNWPEYQNTRSQDLDPAYHDSGAFYWVKTEALLKYRAIITPQTGGIVVDEITVQDIDTETDWKLAELKYQLLQQKYMKA